MSKPGRKARFVWLEFPEYQVVPLKAGLSEHMVELGRAIHRGVFGYPDVARPDFFEVALQKGWAYIHVHGSAHIVYLVAYSHSRFLSSVAGENTSEMKAELNFNAQNNEVTAFKAECGGWVEAASSPSSSWAQIDLLAVILSRALYDEPNFTYVIPDEQQRRAVLPWFFRALALRAGEVCGEIYTTETMEGGALWITPVCHHLFDRVLRMRMPRGPVRLGWAVLRRSLKLTAHLEQIHRRLASGPHWYLMACGIRSQTEQHVIGGPLLDPVLSRADSEGLPCYLETFNPANLCFYKKRGFRIEGAGRIPGGGPNFWALVRSPQSRPCVVAESLSRQRSSNDEPDADRQR
jgi:hypothetical protein